MTYYEIQKRVLELMQKNTELVSNGLFILNKQVEENLKEIESLQSQCTHHFIDGICEYCQKRAIK